jgi:lipoate-protein ligase A
MMYRMQWKEIDTGVASAEENMRLDAQMLEAVQQPILHFYEWERPSITFGHFIEPSKFLNLSSAAARGIDCARRPTGGGIVFHLWDLAFSVLVPAQSNFFSLNTLDNYAFVNQAVLRAVQNFLGKDENLSLTSQDLAAASVDCKRFCMAQPTKYDVVLQGRKIAGAAQRKTKQGFLHQGTIALMLPDRDVLRDVLHDGGIAEAMMAHTYPLGGSKNLDEARKELKQLLRDEFIDENCD